MKIRHHTPLSLAIVFGSACIAKSQTVAWGTSVTAAPNGYYSDGTPTGTSLAWTLGYFAGSFVPTPTNFSEWFTNYVEVDRNTENTFDLGGGNTVSYVDGSANSTPASVNRQAYVFAYNNSNLIGTPSGEVILYRENGFLFPPTGSAGTFDIADNPLDTNDDSFDVIWGQVDRKLDETGGVVSGGGVFSSRIPDTMDQAWEAQAATFVPEPSVAMLGAFGCLALLRRKRTAG